MKTRFHSRLALGLGVLIAGWIISFPFSQVSTDWSSDQSLCTLSEIKQAPQRGAVTFILGSDDDDTDNPYFQHATQYYRQEARAVDTIIDDIHSLTELYDFLRNQRPPNGIPWGQIRLVMHSNPWMGMSVAASPGSKRTTVAQLDRLTQSGQLGALSTTVVDTHTQLQLWGCSLGENQPLLKRMGEVFGISQVVSPRAFVQYQMGRDGQMNRALNQVYYSTYPTGYHPGKGALAKRFARSYSEANVDWQSALQQVKPTFFGTTYNYEFRVPITWIVTYPTSQSRPPVKGTSAQQTWLTEQTALMAQIEKLSMTLDDFTWTIYPTQHTFSDGSREPAIKAIGLCSIVCVLDPVADPESGKGIGYRPLQFGFMDTRFFACVDLPDSTF